jgi:hypothetical protein
MWSTRLNLALSSVAIVGLQLVGCSSAPPNSDSAPGEPKPNARVSLSAYGLPKDFFQPVAEKCANQIIGYRFVVWLNSDDVVVGFNTSPYCRSAPDRKVSGSARLLVFSGSGAFKVQRDVPYLADGNGEIVAEGEARSGPSGTLLFRLESVNLDAEGRSESKSGVLLLDANLKDVEQLDRFLVQTTFINHALVFQEGFTLGNAGTYAIFDGVPLKQIMRRQRDWPVGTRDSKFGDNGIAFMVCQQELRPNEYESTGVVYAGAKQRCTMTSDGDDGRIWRVPLADGETASIVGLLSDGSVVGQVNAEGSKAGRLVIWRRDKAAEVLPWIPPNYCGSVQSATADMSRYAAIASDDCNDVAGLFRLLGVGRKTTDAGHWMIFDRRLPTAITDRVFPKNGRAALSPDGLRYASFEAGELRIYSLPKPE